MADRHSPTVSSSDEKGLDIEIKENASVDQIDLVAYYENNAGRLVVDPEYISSLVPTSEGSNNAINREAKIEFGEAVAKNLKLSSDGSTVLWPQPTDDPEDPQNVRLLRPSRSACS